MEAKLIRVFNIKWYYYDNAENLHTALLDWYIDLKQYRSDVCDDVSGYDGPVIFYANQEDLSPDSARKS
ncbi:hypothetical protein [Leptospira santarosai]|uniref:hypothetical protein n=1 Tax=Leptospira santarosai TaxID=28183 RepID=UPI0002978DE6|nr:hypothetical protein [Leptospira santarosai]EKS10265.1 hypothetical protein LEP1GSC071_3968 [Leptospira santarosai str. JET]